MTYTLRHEEELIRPETTPSLTLSNQFPDIFIFPVVQKRRENRANKTVIFQTTVTSMLCDHACVLDSAVSYFSPKYVQLAYFVPMPAHILYMQLEFVFTLYGRMPAENNPQAKLHQRVVESKGP